MRDAAEHAHHHVHCAAGAEHPDRDEITVVAATPELREALSLPAQPGVLVSGARGIAAFSGIQAGSLILSVNGEVPNSPMAFLALVRKTTAGNPAIIRYWRDGGERSLTLPTDAPGSGDREGLAL